MSTEIESLPYRLGHTVLYSGDDIPPLFAFRPMNDDDTPDTSWVGWKAQWRRFRDPAREADPIDLDVDTTSPDGWIVVSVTGVMRDAMAGHSGVWDIRAFNAHGEELTFATGETSIEWDVTR